MSDYSRLVSERPDWFDDPVDADIHFRGDPPTGRVGYIDQYVTLLVDDVRFGDGREGTYIRMLPAVDRPSGVVILPIIDRTNVLLVRQFRHPVRAWRLELPRGMGERGATAPESAQRELLEETGYIATAWTDLGVVEQDSGLLGMQTHLFLASIDPVQPASQIEFGHHVLRVPISKFVEMIQEGQITDGFTLACWARASHLL